jgi:hypothetical protein
MCKCFNVFLLVKTVLLTSAICYNGEYCKIDVLAGFAQSLYKISDHTAN